MTSSRARQPVEERLADRPARASCQRAGGNPLRRLDSYEPVLPTDRCPGCGCLCLSGPGPPSMPECTSDSSA